MKKNILYFLLVTFCSLAILYIINISRNSKEGVRPRQGAKKWTDGPMGVGVDFGFDADDAASNPNLAGEDPLAGGDPLFNVDTVYTAPTPIPGQGDPAAAAKGKNRGQQDLVPDTPDGRLDVDDNFGAQRPDKFDDGREYVEVDGAGGAEPDYMFPEDVGVGGGTPVEGGGPALPPRKYDGMPNDAFEPAGVGDPRDMKIYDVPPDQQLGLGEEVPEPIVPEPTGTGTVVDDGGGIPQFDPDNNDFFDTQPIPGEDGEMDVFGFDEFGGFGFD